MAECLGLKSPDLLSVCVKWWLSSLPRISWRSWQIASAQRPVILKAVPIVSIVGKVFESSVLF